LNYFIFKHNTENSLSRGEESHGFRQTGGVEGLRPLSRKVAAAPPRPQAQSNPPEEEAGMRHKHLWVITTFILILSVMVTPAWPQGMEIRGTITGRDGLPKGQVSINLQGPKRFITISNSKGEFVLRGVEPGVYVVTLMQADKMHKFSLNITGQTLDLRVPW
jgi:hypothetical protein